MFPVRNANDFVEHSIPVLIKTFSKRGITEDFEAEARKSIGLRDRTEDNVNIVKVRKPCFVTVTFENDIEGNLKYLKA